MRITIDLRRSRTGHLEGVVEGEAGRPALAFHGVIELVNALEVCLAPEPPDDRH
ncbi:hypothetical protein [Nonomuraea jiangxiensis]|uniref:Uncharacterized protein n=1 Tax=Nonomuraea jiangxiensis TaxID=633440 RepID=A0A1G9B9N5_9ACTN|nr:hypothetical protein [Nonomuraea jiangxiensis]SDK36228.1 hypothetical protein SAMN05421869_115200 [Nonomuraea jiangxiensis]